MSTKTRQTKKRSSNNDDVNEVLSQLPGAENADEMISKRLPDYNAVNLKNMINEVLNVSPHAFPSNARQLDQFVQAKMQFTAYLNKLFTAIKLVGFECICVEILGTDPVHVIFPIVYDPFTKQVSACSVHNPSVIALVADSIIKVNGKTLMDARREDLIKKLTDSISDGNLDIKLIIPLFANKENISVSVQLNRIFCYVDSDLDGMVDGVDSFITKIQYLDWGKVEDKSLIDQALITDPRILKLLNSFSKNDNNKGGNSSYPNDIDDISMRGGHGGASFY